MIDKKKEGFTPGPWKVSPDCPAVVGTQEKCVCRCEMDWNLCDGERRANAAMIAAAPDMYSLLAKMLESDRCNIAYFKISVENALKKARGEEQDEW